MGKQVITGRDTVGFGASEVHVGYPDTYRTGYHITLVCNGHRLGKLVLKELPRVAKFIEAIGNDFVVIPAGRKRGLQ